MSHRTRSTSLKALAILALVLALASVATAATSRKTSGTAWVGITHQEGQTLFAAGDVKDKVLGRGAVVFQTTATVGTQPNTVEITATKVTIYYPSGTLTGTGKATQIQHPDGTTTVENGTVALTKGTGKLKGRKFNATFAGPFKDGVYTFTYSGTLK
jgi:Tfp pilus assembly protein FimT